MGRIQARTIKARRRHGEQTCRPAGVLRAHYHASFLHLIQSIGLLCTGSLLPVQIMKQKTHSNPHRNFGNNIENRTSSVWARYGSWSDNCSLSFWVNTTKSFCEGLSSHQPDQILQSTHITSRRESGEKFWRNSIEEDWKITGAGRLRRIHWFLSISRAEARRPPSLRKSLIMTHHSPPNSKIQARTRTKRRARNNRQI